MSAAPKAVMAGLFFFWTAALLQAQGANKRVVLAGENDQVLPRLQAADRLVAWGDAPAAARTIALAGLSCGPQRLLGPFLALALDNNSHEQWAQALEEYQRLLLEEGDALVPGPKGKSTAGFQTPSQLLRRLCHQRLTLLPSPLRKQYRQRVDPEAQKLFQEGKEQRSARPLRRLVDEHFCSSYGDQALDLLGDLAFEQGNFEEAMHWWRQVVLGPGEMPAAETLLFPDPRVDIALVGAKQILALAFLGRHDEARHHLTRWRQVHPTAHGQLAGEKGLLAPIVGAWLDKLASSSTINNDEDIWTTFGGSPGRNRVVPACPSPRLWGRGPAWRVRLPITETDQPFRDNPARLLAFHPLVVGQQVLVADARSVTAFDLHTGKRSFHFEMKSAGLEEPVPGKKAGAGRFTLTAWENLVFARLGRQALGLKKDGDKDEESSSYLVCLDWAQKEDKASRLRWHVKAPTFAGTPGIFEGAPVVHDGNVFTAVSRLGGGGRTLTALVCYDASTGRQRWWREVCDALEFDDLAEPRLRPHLLTLTAGQLVYCNHAGAVVAVDPWTGKPLWGLRYPSRGWQTADGETSPRDLAPCLFAQGRLYVAPFDSTRIFCLDPATGRLLWQRDGTEVVHLLGVARGRLVFTTPRRLQALDAANGSEAWVLPAVGDLPGLGRGLILGNWVFWPTQHPQLPYRAIHLDSGAQERGPGGNDDEPEFFDPTSLRNLLPGNMAFGQGCLVVAGREELVAYVPGKGLLNDAPEPFPKNPWIVKVTPLKETEPEIKIGMPAQVTLSLPLERTLELADATFLPWMRYPDGRSPEQLVVRRSGRVECISFLEPPQFRKQPALAAEANFVAGVGDAWVYVGSGGIRARTMQEGKDLWQFVGPGPLSGFQLNDRLLFCLCDQRCLIALDPLTGQPAWYRWAPAGEIRPLSGGGLYHPHYHAGDRFVILQTNAGQLLVLDSRTGFKLREAATATEPWPLAPASLGEDHLVLPEPDGKVRLFQPSTAQTLWQYEPPGASSLTGALPQIIVREKVLLALIPRNLGPDLVRIDARKGVPLWTIPLHKDLDFRTVSIAGDAVYFALGNRLQARALSSGKQLWEKPLPGDHSVPLTSRKRVVGGAEAAWSRWQMQPAGAALIVYPAQEVALTWPHVEDSALWWIVAPRMTRIPPRERAVLLVDRKDGQLIQRLVLSPGHGSVTVQVLPNHLIAGCDGKTWVFRSARAE